MRGYGIVTYIKNEEGVLCCHDLWWAVCRDFCDLLVQPFVPSLGEGDLITSSFENKYMFYIWAVFESGIHDRLGGDRFPTSATFVCGQNNARLTIKNAIAERFRAKPSKNNRVYSSNTSAGEESGNGLPCHGQVNRNCIALFDAKPFEDIRNRAHFSK